MTSFVLNLHKVDAFSYRKFFPKNVLRDRRYIYMDWFATRVCPFLLSPVSKEVVNISELLYASDLVLMAPTMEQPGRCVAEWRVSILDKGLKVNSGRSKD